MFLYGFQLFLMWIERGLDPWGALLSLQRKLVCRISSGSLVCGELWMSRNGLSVKEAFAPGMEAARDGVFSELMKKKPVALSKLRTKKKFLGEPLDLTQQMKGEDTSISLLEEDRDD
ncbi:unnamed protein product [Eruca vesicaria subsp. sativa]|uniref:Uncharacterized protein n=1 Tax=Eruca vesicaria subsp. sativa TaxID=29727 RepID=A0ABC8IRL5_ERUVS|nr:unnamed protein product [Eruca vesicaria subsp. sativa]